MTQHRWRGAGYHEEPYRIGEIVEEDGEIMVVARAWKVWVNEDGMSLGVGADRGYLYHAELRPATAEEAESYCARRAAAEEAEKAEKAELNRFQSLRAQIFSAPGCRNADFPPPGAETIMIDGEQWSAAWEEIQAHGGRLFWVKFEGSAQFGASAPEEEVKTECYRST